MREPVPMLKSHVQEFLIKHDCPMEYTGFNVLVDVLCEACESLSEVRTNLKSIYISVEQKYKMTRLNIERNLRTLIEKWEPEKKFKDLFKETPTNAKLIVTLAHKVQRPNSSVYDIYMMP